jgi:hypothetical protein
MNIFQIYYAERQLIAIEKGFKPFDNTKNPKPEWREYYVFREAYQKGLMQDDLTGFLSWKFSAKTYISGDQFINFINDKPGADVYLINPFQEEADLYLNCWIQGERYHPGILALAQELFDKIGHKLSLTNLVMPSEKTLYCNFFVATQNFWNRYIEFCDPFYQLIQSDLENPFFNKSADKLIDADYRVFIFERLFSSFLILNPDIHFESYDYSQSQLESRYGDITPIMLKARNLKSQLSQKFEIFHFEEFKKISQEALNKRTYGSNSAWWRRKLQWIKPYLFTK